MHLFSKIILKHNNFYKWQENFAEAFCVSNKSTILHTVAHKETGSVDERKQSGRLTVLTDYSLELNS